MMMMMMMMMVIIIIIIVVVVVVVATTTTTNNNNNKTFMRRFEPTSFSVIKREYELSLLRMALSDFEPFDQFS
jgi:maltose-binding protein MalE